jgi:hypothetical protein
MQRSSVRELVSVIKLLGWRQRAFCANLVTDKHTVIFHWGAYMSLFEMCYNESHTFCDFRLQPRSR